jgi:hypothetical protein
MIQRIQTVWWLVSIVALGTLTMAPLFKFGDPLTSFTAFHHCHFLFGTAIAAAVLTLVTIFLYKKRKLQIKLGYVLYVLHVLMFIAIGAHYYLDKGTEFTPWVALPAVSLVCQIIAIGGVKKDEALVKSMDRLR